MLLTNKKTNLAGKPAESAFDDIFVIKMKPATKKPGLSSRAPAFGYIWLLT